MWTFLNLITAILGFIVFGILLLTARKNQFVNLFLGLGFFAMAYRSLGNYTVAYNIANNTFFIGHVSFVFYLIAPCIYLYFRSVLNDEQSLKKGDWLHFLLPALAILLLIYYTVESYLIFGKVEFHVPKQIFNDKTPFRFYIQTGLHALLIFAQCALYTAFSWRLVIIKLGKRKNEHPQLIKVRTWVITLLSIFTFLVTLAFIGAILKIVFNIDITFNINVDLIRSIGLLYLFTHVLFKTDLLFGIPNLKTKLPSIDSIPLSGQSNETKTNIAEEIVEDTIDTEPTGHLYFDNFGWIQFQESDKQLELLQKQPSGTIEKDKVNAYIKRINTYLETEPYKNTDFDIKSISNELQAPLYHIEYIFRYYNKYSFSEFRNVMRINYVLKQLEMGAAQNYTMEAIGLNAGFSSRSSFFRVFKTVTGKTPKQVIENSVAE